MNSIYTLRDISFAYGADPVLRVNHLEITSGSIVALLGPNGSGKTTLLHILAFLDSPQEGHLEFFGQRVHGRNTLTMRRKVALLLQSPYIFHETVLDNIIWGLRIRSVSRERAHSIALNALERVGLGGFGPRYAPSLSGGEAQRVAMARAIALDPTVLLLDEPFNHMDREAVRLTEDIVAQLRHERGVTVVFTSHLIEKVHAVANQVVHLWQGRIAPTGPDNLFKGVLIDEGSRFNTGTLTIRLARSMTQGEFVAVDPSHVQLVLSGEPNGSVNSFHGRIVSLIEENGRVRVVVEAGERFVTFVRYEDRLMEHLVLGSSVGVTFASTDVTVL